MDGLGAGAARTDRAWPRAQWVAALATAIGVLVALSGAETARAAARQRAGIRSTQVRIPVERLPSLRSRALRAGPWTDETTLCAPFPFTAFGVRWRQRSGGDLHARVRSGASRAALGPAREVEADRADGPDAGSREWRASRRSTDLLWTGRARCVGISLRLPRGAAIEAPTAVFIDSSGGGSAPPAPSRRRGGLQSQEWSSHAAYPREPAIVTRRMWGARKSLRNCRPSYARKLKAAFVHHTAGSNDYSPRQSDDIVRAIYHYHTQVNGWCDIAYNFLVDQYGTIFEGRAGGMTRPVVPAAQQGFNVGAVAVSAMGNFEVVEPSAAAIRSLGRLLAWRLDVAHLPPLGRARLVSTGGPSTRYPAGRRVSLRVVSGHRRTGRTACPGAHLRRLLPDIRAAAAAAGRPKIFRPRRSAGSLVPGSEGVVIRARSSDELRWTVEVTSGGHVVRSLKDAGTRLRVRWRGFGDDRAPVARGRYRVTIRGTRRDGRGARPARLRVKVRS